MLGTCSGQRLQDVRPQKVAALRFPVVAAPKTSHQVYPGSARNLVLHLQSGRLHVNTVHDHDAQSLQKKKLDEWWRAFGTLRGIVEVRKGGIIQVCSGYCWGIEGADYGFIEGRAFQVSGLRLALCWRSEAGRMSARGTNCLRLTHQPKASKATPNLNRSENGGSA